MQREINKKEEEVANILESYLPLKIEIKRLKVAAEDCETELNEREGDLARARSENDPLQNLDLMKGQIESKRRHLQQQGGANK